MADGDELVVSVVEYFEESGDAYGGREVRDELGASGISSHSFRKTVATLIDEEGLSARIGADQLGHAHVSMTQNVYMTRGRVHTQVAELLDRTVAVGDESATFSR
jgi:integrase